MQSGEIILCNTPAYMVVDLCKGCMRATSVKDVSIKIHTLKATKYKQWSCDHYLPKEKDTNE